MGVHTGESVGGLPPVRISLSGKWAKDASAPVSLPTETGGAVYNLFIIPGL